MQKPAKACKSLQNYAKACTSTQKPAQVSKSLHKYAKTCTSMQKPAQVCKSMQKNSKAYSKQKQILWHLFPTFFQILWWLFPAFFQIWDSFSKKNKFLQQLFRQLLMALLTIFYGFFVLLFVQYKIHLAHYKSLITFFLVVGGKKWTKIEFFLN